MLISSVIPQFLVRRVYISVTLPVSPQAADYLAPNTAPTEDILKLGLPTVMRNQGRRMDSCLKFFDSVRTPFVIEMSVT